MGNPAKPLEQKVAQEQVHGTTGLKSILTNNPKWWKCRQLCRQPVSELGRQGSCQSQKYVSKWCHGRVLCDAFSAKNVCDGWKRNFRASLAERLGAGNAKGLTVARCKPTHSPGDSSFWSTNLRKFNRQCLFFKPWNRDSEILLLQLVYISSARTVISEKTCAEILSVSRRNNCQADVSGLLVAGQRRFLQALEGPADAVRATYSRILHDPRHYACVLLGERYLDKRQFGDWAMGYTAGGCDAPEDAGLASIVDALVVPLTDANLRAQFTGFAELQSRCA